MNSKELEHIVNTISKGDTTFAEALFDKPGGRKYLENIVLIVLSNLPNVHDDKEDLYIAFIKALDKIEKRIKRQREGQRILSQVYN